MNKKLLTPILVATCLFSLNSCKKENDDNNNTVKPYIVPSTYNFANADYQKSATLVKMISEIDAYLKRPHSGSGMVSIDQGTLNNMFNNSGNPFAAENLNSSGINLNSFTTDAALFKSFADSVILFNNGITATQGVGGWMPRGSNKIVIGPKGLEYVQAYTKGVMGALLFKNAVSALQSVRNIDVKDTLAAQKKWDEAFGLLGAPSNYSPDSSYASTNPNRPLLWGGYFAERGKKIDAGRTLFNAFVKGRAAIGAYDISVRNAKIDIILDKWEQLAAVSILEYATSPTASSNIGNLGSQLHALSEGFGFMYSLKYRPASSKLSSADYETLQAIFNKDLYSLVAQTGFTDLVTVQNILKKTYGL